MGLIFSHIWFQVTVFHCAWWSTRHELSMWYTFQNHNREQVFLSCFDVHVRVPEGLCYTRNSHKTILCATNRECRDFIVVVRSTVLVDNTMISSQYRSHQNLSLDNVSIAVRIALSHHTAKRMTCQNYVVACETFFSKFFESIRNVVVNQNGIWCIENKIRKTNPNLLSFSNTLILNLSSDSLIRSIVTGHTVNPNDSNISACRSHGRHYNQISLC